MKNSNHDPARSSGPAEVHGPNKFQWTPRAIASVVGLVVAVIFILSNRQTSRISFLWIHVTMPVWVALLVATLLGLVIGAGTGYRRGKNSGTAKATKKK